jgi:hypothetical protein
LAAETGEASLSLSRFFGVPAILLLLFDFAEKKGEEILKIVQRGDSGPWI